MDHIFNDKCVSFPPNMQASKIRCIARCVGVAVQNCGCFDLIYFDFVSEYAKNPGGEHCKQQKFQHGLMSAWYIP